MPLDIDRSCPKEEKTPSLFVSNGVQIISVPLSHPF